MKISGTKVAEEPQTFVEKQKQATGIMLFSINAATTGSADPHRSGSCFTSCSGGGTDCNAETSGVAQNRRRAPLLGLLGVSGIGDRTRTSS